MKRLSLLFACVGCIALLGGCQEPQPPGYAADRPIHQKPVEAGPYIKKSLDQAEASNADIRGLPPENETKNLWNTAKEIGNMPADETVTGAPAEKK